jgi:hypothetical protein
VMDSEDRDRPGRSGAKSRRNHAKKSVPGHKIDLAHSGR